MRSPTKREVAWRTGAQDIRLSFQFSLPAPPYKRAAALPEDMHYTVKSSASFWECAPEVAARSIKEPNTKDRKFEDVVKSAEQAAVLVY